MTTYAAPIRDMQFVLHDVLEISKQDLPGYADLEPDFTAAILDAAGKIASEVLAPLNGVGDREGCTLENGVVRTPTGFLAAFDQMREGGWTALDCDPEYGGQGMPYVVGLAAGEMFSASNMAFTMYQGLTHGAYSRDPRPWHRRAEGHLSAQDGQLANWTGTMNLTEPHCGTDLGLLRTKAEPQDDGSYLITGQEDLHLGRRSRHVGKHRPSGAGQGPGRRRRRQGHLALHRAEIPGQG